MQSATPQILRRIESLILKTQSLRDVAADEDKRKKFDEALKGLAALAGMTMGRQELFAVEPWHPLKEGATSDAPGEMLLRLKSRAGACLPPYPFIMTFYENGMAAEIDSILFLCALEQFRQSGETRMSVNISAQSLRNAAFIKAALSGIEKMRISGESRIIVEIHESAPGGAMSAKALGMFRKFGVAFAIDDVGLHMNDVLRLAGFESMADYIKLDRQALQAELAESPALGRVISLVHALLPRAAVVAEGVKSAMHAMELRRAHPAILYAQGMHLPDRAAFQRAVF